QTNVKAGQPRGYLQGLAVRTIEKRYLTDPPPADFRVNVNPLVSWIWVGGAIAAIGGLVAIWPAPEARRRRGSDVCAARWAGELGCAQPSPSGDRPRPGDHPGRGLVRHRPASPRRRRGRGRH